MRQTLLVGGVQQTLLVGEGYNITNSVSGGGYNKHCKCKWGRGYIITNSASGGGTA